MVRPVVGFRQAGRSLAGAARSPTVLGAGAFLFLWNFNPFSTVVLRHYMTGVLGLTEEFYGTMQSLMAVASILACLAYPAMARRVTPASIVRLSIVLGVASTLAYWGLSGRASAMAVTLAVGFIYMMATLIQLDLAARACPPEAAGSVFALLMALENLAAATSTAMGGWCFERWAELWGPVASFRALVAVGAAFTAASWLLLPLLRKAESGEDSPLDA